GCLDRVETALRGAATDRARDVDLEMAANLRRLVLRDFPADTSDGLDAVARGFNARDRSMYENLRWQLARLPRGAKVIVWCANNHAAKELRSVPGLERRVPLGSYIHRDFGDAAFAAATTAYAGSYALGRHPAQTWPPAPPGSLESRTLQGDVVPARYLPARWLRQFGPVPSRVLGTTFATAAWAHVLDGVVVFRDDALPHPLP
ncbi:MAG TPA: erythromycin esterase family protein, partial [Longimicrobiales bacterium]